MASDTRSRKKKGKSILQWYIKNLLCQKKEEKKKEKQIQVVFKNRTEKHGLVFPTSTKGSLMYHPTDRIAHTMAFAIPVVEHWQT